MKFFKLSELAAEPLNIHDTVKDWSISIYNMLVDKLILSIFVTHYPMTQVLKQEHLVRCMMHHIRN